MKSSKLKTKGTFYIPEYEDKKIYGELIINGNSIVLEALDGLPDKELVENKKRTISARGNKPEYEKVIGLTNEGSVVLLKNHFGRSQKYKYLRETSEHFPIAFVSEENLENNNDLEFQEIIISMCLLNSFVNKTNIVQKNTVGKSNYKKITLDIDLSNNTFFQFETDKYQLLFETSYTLPVRGTNTVDYNEAKIQEYIKLRVVAKKKKLKKDDIINLVFAFRDFIAFALDKSIYLTQLVARNPFSEKSALRSDPDRKYLNTDIYIAERNYEEVKNEPLFNHLFTVNDIENDFSIFIDNWLNLKDKYSVLYNNYFTYLDNPGALFESQFLKLIIGAQDYFKKNKVLLKNLTLTKEEKDLIKDSKNGETFLRDLIMARKLLVENLQKKISLEDLVEIKAIRNGIAHDRLTKEDYEGIREKSLFLKLVAINQYCIMTAIGMSTDFINGIFKRKRF